MAAEVLIGLFSMFFSMIFMVVIIALMFLPLIFWILMLVDCAKRKYKKENDKVMWILIVALLGVIGAAVYYFVVKRPDKH